MNTLRQLITKGNGVDIKSIIERLEITEHKRRIDRDKEDEAWESEWRLRAATAQDQFLSKCRKATVRDYAKWLKWCMEYEKPTRLSEFNFTDNFLIIKNRGAVITPLYGADAVKIIVPKRMKVKIDGLGHNRIFSYDKDLLSSHDGITIYKDVKGLLLK